MKRCIKSALSLLLLAATITCAPRAAQVLPDTDAGLSALRLAVERRDARAVWAMLSPPSRHRWANADEFERWFSYYGEDVQQWLNGVNTRPQIVVRYSGGVDLIKEGGAWRVRKSLVDVGARTPKEALMRLRVRLSTLMVSGDVSEAMAGQLKGFIGRLDRAMNHGPSLSVKDDQARALLGNGGWVELVKSGQYWTVNRLSF